MYIGITVNLTVLPTGCLDGTNLSFDKLTDSNGIIYARKASHTESLLIPAYELETIKGFIRRLPIEVYNLLNDDFGVHPSHRPRPAIKAKAKI
jgi:hypothetical protein